MTTFFKIDKDVYASYLDKKEELSLYEVELKRVQRLRVALSVSTSTYVIVTDSEAEDIAKLLYDNS